MSQILIVSADDGGLNATLHVLRTAGYCATGASSLTEARAILADSAPDLVIADERLGAFNGLHVIVTARAEHPGVGAIVTTPVKNRGLEADARSLNARCMVKPRNAAGWLAAVSGLLTVERVA
jgi:DNA-binding response OmpR family regulator